MFTKNVFIINSIVRQTGIGRYTTELYTLLKPYSRLINFVTVKEKLQEDPNGELVTGFLPQHLTSGWFINNYFFKWIFRKKLRELKSEIKKGNIIHYAHPINDPIKSKNSVVTIHDVIATKNIGNRRLLISLLFKKALRQYKKLNNIITVSKYVKHDLETLGFTGDIKVIYPPLAETFIPLKDQGKIRELLRLPLEKILILSISNTEKHKNLIMVKKAMDRLGKEFKLVRVGQPVGKSITFQNVDDITLNKIYNACDVLLFPTLEEGFGYPIIEAFGTGLPVVSSNIPVIKEVANDAVALVDPLDLDSIVEGIHKALENKQYYKIKGLEKAKNYSRDKFRKKMLQYYEQIT